MLEFTFSQLLAAVGVGFVSGVFTGNYLFHRFQERKMEVNHHVARQQVKGPEKLAA